MKNFVLLCVNFTYIHHNYYPCSIIIYWSSLTASAAVQSDGLKQHWGVLLYVITAFAPLLPRTLPHDMKYQLLFWILEVSSQSHPWIPHFNIKPRDQDLLSSWWMAWWGFCCCFGYFGVCCILNVALVGLDYVVAFSYPLAMYPAHNWTQINGPIALHYN